MNTKDTKYNRAPWQGYIAPEWQDIIQEPEQWLADNTGELVVSYPSREVRRIKTPNGVLYVKIIRALTDQGLTGRDLGSFLKWYCRPSRAIATWHISWKILAAGFCCARPVLAVRKRSHWLYPTDIFVSEDVQAKEVSTLIPEYQEPAKQTELATILGQQLGAFHSAGFVHGDCILRNLCLNANQQLVFLDNDRSKKRGWQTPFCSSRRNLAQIGYSAQRLGLPESFVQKLFSEYAIARQWSDNRVTAVSASLLSEIKRRLQKRERNIRRKSDPA